MKIGHGITIKKNAIYYICKVLNWIVPLFMIFCCTAMLGSTSPCVYYIVGAYAAFWIVKYIGYGRGRGRMLYNLCAFAGSIITIVILWSDNESFFELLLDPVKATPFEKTVIISLCFTAIICRIVTLIFETPEYIARADERYEERLDADVLEAANRLEFADNVLERQKATAQLEEAKVRRDSYYNYRK